MEQKLSTLDFAIRQRSSTKLPAGTSQDERNYLDFVIDGQSLAERTRYDLVSILCKEWVPDEREKSVRRLLREEAADFPDDRRSLLVCPKCGDIGCGAVSIIIEVSENSVRWRDFGYQNNYEPEIHGVHLKNLGPFEFDLSDYKSKLSHALEMLKAPS
jgi:hypothetical protein